jgi:hypothetical protein
LGPVLKNLHPLSVALVYAGHPLMLQACQWGLACLAVLRLADYQLSLNCWLNCCEVWLVMSYTLLDHLLCCPVVACCPAAAAAAEAGVVSAAALHCQIHYQVHQGSLPPLLMSH